MNGSVNTYVRIGVIVTHHPVRVTVCVHIHVQMKSVDPLLMKAMKFILPWFNNLEIETL